MRRRDSSRRTHPWTCGLFAVPLYLAGCAGQPASPSASTEIANAAQASGNCTSAPVVLTAGAGGSITEDNGTVLTISDNGDIQEGGNAVPGGSGSKAVTYVSGVVWGQDAGSGGWHTRWTGSHVAGTIG